MCVHSFKFVTDGHIIRFMWGTESFIYHYCSVNEASHLCVCDISHSFRLDNYYDHLSVFFAFSELSR